MKTDTPDYLALAATSERGAELAQCLLRAGARPAKVKWEVYDIPQQRCILQCVRPQSVHELPTLVQTVWRRNQRYHERLLEMLQAVRARLDRPPVSQGTQICATREDLVKQLRTAGRRFAREYWTEGIPIFFPGRDFGPVPPQFLFPPPSQV